MSSKRKVCAQVAGFPDFDPTGIGREHGPSDVVGADEVELACFHNPHDLLVCPDVFADQRAGAGAFIIVVFGDPVQANSQSADEAADRRFRLNGRSTVTYSRSMANRAPLFECDESGLKWFGPTW